VEETLNIGKSLAEKLHGGEKIIISGELGSGKTVLVKGIVAGLGSNDEVTSPTFVIEKIYEGRVRVRHIDLINSELLLLEIDDIHYSSDILLIEWGEKLPQEYRKDAITINIDFAYDDENSRIIYVNGL